MVCGGGHSLLCSSARSIFFFDELAVFTLTMLENPRTLYKPVSPQETVFIGVLLCVKLILEEICCEVLISFQQESTKSKS